MTLRIMGIDPGHGGALCIVSGPDAADDIRDMPIGNIQVGKTVKKRISPELLAMIIRKSAPVDVAYIEEVSAMPRQGVSSSFAFGQGHGMLLGVLAAFSIRTVRIRPQIWRKEVSLKASDKSGSIMRAIQLFPASGGLLTLKKHDGRAEALLIAWAGYCMEKRHQ